MLAYRHIAEAYDSRASESRVCMYAKTFFTQRTRYQVEVSVMRSLCEERVRIYTYIRGTH